MNFIAWFKLLRPHQWLKNLMLFFPPFLGGRITDTSILIHGALPFSAFCLAASSTYIINDIIDAPNDACHPKKKTRPIAAGVVSSGTGLVLAIFLGFGSLALAFQIPGRFAWMIVGYMALSLIYSLKLKDVAIVDLFCISIFFLLRLSAGGEAFGVKVSDWLFLSGKKSPG